MERVQDAEQTVEVFENEIQMYLSMFCESNAIESEYDILPSQWNAALSYIYKHVIKPNPDILTIPHTVSNSYNINAVDDLLEMYIYMCYCHNQEISIKGFCLLSGISRDTIHSWGNSNTISIAVYNLRQFLIAAKSVFEKMGKLFKRVRDVIDDIRYFFETVQDRLGYPVSRRYNFVKILGNIGYRKHDVWVATRTYLPRSNC